MAESRSWPSAARGLISAARETGLPALSLSVETNNYARRLYEDLEFKAVSEASGSITMKLYL